MADLKTNIGGDDSEFQTVAARVDARITAFSRQAKHTTGLIKGMMSGFGAVGAAAALNGIVQSCRDLADQAQRARDSLQESAQAAVDANEEIRRSMSGAEKGPADISRENAKRIAAEVRGYQDEIMRLGKLGFWDVFKNDWLQTDPYLGKIFGESDKYISEQITDLKEKAATAQRQLEASGDRLQIEFKKKKERETLAGASADLEKSSKEWQSYYQKLSTDRERFIADLASDKSMIAALSGNDALADSLRAQENARRRRRELDENEFLSPSQLIMASIYAGNIASLENQAGAEKRLHDAQKMAKSIGFSASGSSFGQQMADLDRPLKEQSQIQREILDAVLNLNRTLSESNGATYSP